MKRPATRPPRFIFVPLAMVGFAAALLSFWGAALFFQKSLMTDTALLGSYTRIGAILMFVPAIFPALGIGLMFANCIVWCFPGLRSTFDEDAVRAGRPTFKEAMGKLLPATILLVVICAPIIALGAMNYFWVAEDGIHLNPLFSINERRYSWQDVTGIETRCIAERSNLHLNFRLKMRDGATVDLIEEPRMRFVDAYPSIKPLLEGLRDVDYTRQITVRGVQRLRARYGERKTRRILAVLRMKSG